MSMIAPGILAALFGTPYLKKLSGPATDDTKPTPPPGPESSSDSFGNDLKIILDKWLSDTNSAKYIRALVIILIVCVLLLGAILFMSLILFIQVQVKNYKMNQELQQKPQLAYKDTLDYVAMDASVFAEYPYRALFYLTAIGFSLMILALLFQYQLKINDTAAPSAAGGPDDEDNPVGDIVFWLTLIFVYLFVACYWVIEKGYYTKIQAYSQRVSEFNQYITTILPVNYKALTYLSTAPEGGLEKLDESVFKGVLENTRPNKRELVRTICILNLYRYYYSKKEYYRGDYGIFQCFSPIQRLIGIGNSTCFTNYLIYNDTYVPNHVQKYAQMIEQMDIEDPIYRVFKKNRVSILMDVDKMMNEINRRGSCLGSKYAYHQFVRMTTYVVLIVWIPMAIFLGMAFMKVLTGLKALFGVLTKIRA